MLWVDKYRPVQLDKLTYNDGLTQQLKRISAKENVQNMCHLLFYGPPGAGKKTRIMALLREIYGPGVEKLKVEIKNFKFKSSSVDITFITSNYHVEINPSDVGPYRDRDVAQEVIKEIAQSHAPSNSAAVQFKIVLLNEVDKMSRDGQAALRRTMEKYTSACRFVLVCNNASKVIEPLRSRCICLRVPAPRDKEVEEILCNVYRKEVKKELPVEAATKISNMSNRNLRKALLMLESTYVKFGVVDESSQPQLADWEVYVGMIAHNILEDQSPKKLLEIRGQFYELLASCIPPELILQKLALELLRKLDDSVKVDILQNAAFFEHRLQLGSKPIFHLEAFAAKAMVIYKKWSIEFMEMCDEMDD
ncbi:replication factor C subunit 3 [Guillardia theta CCMP2712]|uniref:Replication factor C subunit 3 n=2 Tax=Guillardia theta TaxID=55529 RepID=L1JXN2_GUITC|nr:replication factor C subunit 3 [Guillardia theta CCMP2712]EKX52843.1 replication factor C subunit 3 [Guillardia theta CCMP2712]|eukprot:XP_005839823.1 replication factor C subunit 3 [Guillardia theta CCMP2712]